MSGKVGYPLYGRFWGRVLRILLGLFVRVAETGLEHVPAEGAGIIYYNHIHWLDPAVVCKHLRRYAVPLAKIETSRAPVLGWILRRYGTIFIRRGEVDRAALEAIWKALSIGYPVVVAPEGTRSHDSRLQRAKEGLAFIARQAPDAWLIPAAVTGTTVFDFTWDRVFRRPTVYVRYGRPFRVRWPRAADGAAAVPGGRQGREFLTRVTDQAMAQLAALLPAEMRGDYADYADIGQDLIEVLNDASAAG